MKRNQILILSLGLNAVFLIAGFWLVQRLGGPSYFWYRWKTKGRAVLYDHKKSQFEFLEMDSSSIVFLGNSLTDQGNWQEWLPEFSIANRGISGDMTGGVYRRLDPIIQAHPKKIFLLIGVNDLLFKSVEDTFQKYEQIVKNFLDESPATVLYLQSLLPVNNEVRYTGIQKDQVLALNSRIASLAIEKQLTFINVHNELKDESGNLRDDYTLDGIHLNGLAYAKWVAILKPYLEE
jgi:lysophospholipase L1-like esterase